MTFDEFWHTFLQVPDRETGHLVAPVPHLAQQEVITALDATRTEGGRVYPNVFLHWARKSAKDFTLAAYVLYHLVFDPFEHEPRYAAIAAWDEAQTFITRRTAEQLIARHPDLRRWLTVQKNQIIYRDTVRDPRTGGEYRVEHLAEFLARDTKGSHGLPISLKIHNELHTDRDQSFEEALTVSPARRSPVSLFASYHGLKVDMHPGMPLFDLLERVERKDPAVFYSYIGGSGDRAPDRIVPWITAAWMQEEQVRLRHTPNLYRRMILNVPAGADQGLIAAEELRAAADRTLRPVERGVTGQRFVMTVDLGLTNDFAALMLGTTDADARAVVARAEAWAGTPEAPIDLQTIEDRIVELSYQFELERVILDSWQAAHLCQRLQRRGIPAVLITFESNRMDRVITLTKNTFARRLVRIPAAPATHPAVLGADGQWRYQPNAEALLIEQLENVKTTESRIGKRDTLKFAPSGKGLSAGAHDDLVVALGLLLEAIEKRIGSVAMDPMPNGCGLKRAGQPVECYLWGGMFVPTGQPECRVCPGHLSTMRASEAHHLRSGQALPLREFVRAGLIRPNTAVLGHGLARAVESWAWGQ